MEEENAPAMPGLGVSEFPRLEPEIDGHLLNGGYRGGTTEFSDHQEGESQPMAWRGATGAVKRAKKKIDLVVWGVKGAQEPINFFSLRNIRRKLKNKIFTIIVFNFFFSKSRRDVIF